MRPVPISDKAIRHPMCNISNFNPWRSYVKTATERIEQEGHPFRVGFQGD